MGNVLKNTIMIGKYHKGTIRGGMRCRIFPAGNTWLQVHTNEARERSYSIDDAIAPQADRSNTINTRILKLKKDRQTQLDNQNLQFKDDNRWE